MRKLLIRAVLAAAAVAAWVYLDTPAPAHAGWGINCFGTGGRYGIQCHGFDPAAPTAKIIDGPAARGLTDDAEARARKWEQFCKPTPVRGKYGVITMTYAHEDCEYGRTD